MATVDEIKVIEIGKIYYTKKDYLPDFITKNNLGPGPWIGSIIVVGIIILLIYYSAVGVLWCLIPLGIIVAILGYYLIRRMRYINEMMKTNEENEQNFIKNKPELHGKKIIFTDKSDRDILRKKGHIN